MSKYGNSYSGNDFLEWWKTHYGTDYDGKSGIVKTEGMTDEDVAIGKSLLNSYNEQQLLTQQYNENVATETDKYNSLIASSDKAYDSQLAGAQAEYDTSAQLLLDNYNKNSATAKDIYDRNTAELLANYGTAQSALDKSKRQSQQNASITLDKLKKYLPTQIKAQGLGGLGASESSMLQAYNNYNSEMGSIESGYQESKTNLDTNYNTNKNAYDTAYQETQGSLDEMYGQSKANLDNSFNTTKVNLESAKSQASDTFKAQLADSLAKLKQGYDAGIFASDKDANGNLLVDNVLQEYAKMLSEEQGVNYATALEAIRNAVYTTGDEMNSFVEQYRGKVNDQQLAALFQEGTNVANANAETARKEQAAKTEKEQASNYENALTAIGQSAYSTMDEMNAFIEQFRGKVTESQLNSLFQTGKGVVDTNAAKQAEQLRQEQAAKDEADRQNAYIVAQATMEEYIADGKFDLARQYLDTNKATFGDSGYQSYLGRIQSGTQTTAKNTYSSAIDTFLTTNYSSISSSKAAYDKIMSDLEAAKGDLGDAEYNALVEKMNSTSSNSCSGGWYIQGLGTGRENDDIDITIGSTSRKGNGAKEYDLLCGAAVTDENIVKALNKLATGSESSTPATEGTWWTWLHSDTADSNSTAGKLVVYLNQMFIYTTQGWKTVKADNDASQLQDAINAFLGK